jgi:hypothetical protein
MNFNTKIFTTGQWQYFQLFSFQGVKDEVCILNGAELTIPEEWDVHLFEIHASNLRLAVSLSERQALAYRITTATKHPKE